MVSTADKIKAFLCSDLLCGMRVSVRYLIGSGAARRARASLPLRTAGRKIPFRNAGKCSGCRLCVNICPAKAVQATVKLQGGGVSSGIDVLLDGNRCLSCGLCIEACPEKALKFEEMENNVRR